MKIYTKGGDTGSTSLWGGRRISKASLRLDAYGTIDELNVHIGLIRDTCNVDEAIPLLADVQHVLFNFGAVLSADPDKKGLKLPALKEEWITELEAAIDGMEEELPPLKNFILPGGHINVSYCHLGRVVCRRAERLIAAVHDESEVNPIIIKYINRLSDYLFVLSRYVAQSLAAPELPWKP
jgi:cob(I)alamin adenosyltransferase